MAFGDSKFRSNIRRSPGRRISHASEGLHHGTLLRCHFGQTGLIGWGDTVDQPQQDLFRRFNSLTNNELTRHHDESRIPVRHVVQCHHAMRQILDCNRVVTIEFSGPIEQRYGLLLVEGPQRLRIKEVVEWLSYIGHRIEVHRCRCYQGTTIFVHEELTNCTDLLILTDLF